MGEREEGGKVSPINLHRFDLIEPVQGSRVQDANTFRACNRERENAVGALRIVRMRDVPDPKR